MSGNIEETPAEPSNVLPSEEADQKIPQAAKIAFAGDDVKKMHSPHLAIPDEMAQKVIQKTETPPVENIERKLGIPHIPSPKEAVMGALHTARETLIGSKSLTTEIKHLGSDYADMAKTAITTPPKILWDLVRLHPIDAVGKAVGGSNRILGDMIHVATSPIRLATAGAVNTTHVAGSALKTAAYLPFATAEFVAKSPFRLWRTVDHGLDWMFKISDQSNQWAGNQIEKITKD